MKVRIATRKSPLALWQAEHVAAALKAVVPAMEVSLVERTTKGDKILDQALSKVGGKDLFVKEIEDALLSHEAEVAVHSLKDMPTDLPVELQITAFPPREDARDALVSFQGYTLASLPDGSKVATSSLRRAAQLRRARPDLVVVGIRGNVQTRLARLKREGLAATVLAYAGLLRLGLADLASEILDQSVCLPAIGQGILGVETRADAVDLNPLVARLDDPRARAAANAERAFLRRLEGGCQVPIAGHTFFEDEHHIRFEGLVSTLDGRRIFRGERRGSIQEATALAVDLAEDILGQGADRVLAELKATTAA